MKRSFTKNEKSTLYVASNGTCLMCGDPLPTSWHADHIHPWSKGGKTDLINGQALCPKCNLSKGSKIVNSREWQDSCYIDWKAKDKKDYLIAATPGAGKTTMAIRIAFNALESGAISRVVVVVPTEYLKFQWTQKGAEMGLQLDPYGKGTGLETSDYHGMVTTYQAIAVGSSQLHRYGTRIPTMVIFDEIHHAGDGGSWGESLQFAFENAVYRIGLSGTPFRSDNSYIPFVKYEEQKDGTRKSETDFAYTYGQALADNVLKKIDFVYIDGVAKWSFNGELKESGLSQETEDPSVVSQRLRSAVNIDKSGPSDWLLEAVKQADEKLNELRRDVRPDTGGIIFVEDQWKAKLFETNKQLHGIMGGQPVVVYSDKPESKDLIKVFRESSDKWIVSVKQVSEGVDIPRLAVCVYATIEKTELIFRQRIARILRVQTTYPENIDAFAYIPADLDIMELAKQIERERDHVLDSDEIEKKSREIPGERESFEFTPGEMFDVHVAGVISGSRVYTVDPETASRISKNTNSPIDMVFKILEAWISIQKNESVKVIPEAAKASTPISERIASAKQYEDRIVGKLANALSGKQKTLIGEKKKEINSALLRSLGKAKHDCTLDELESRKHLILGWLKDAKNN